MHIELNRESILLIGAGGHGKVVLDALFSMGIRSLEVSVYDANKQRPDKFLLGLEVNFEDPRTIILGKKFHISIGDSCIREKISEELLALGGSYLKVIHPRAVISPYSSIDDGVYVAANCIVNPSARVGLGTILNHGSVIDHDCSVGRYSHIAPLVTLGGGVCIGDRVLIGIGANILPGIRVGNDAVVGAGAVVVKDVKSKEVVVGIPAKLIK